jgi:hypothetical protein
MRAEFFGPYWNTNNTLLYPFLKGRYRVFGDGGLGTPSPPEKHKHKKFRERKLPKLEM